MWTTEDAKKKVSHIFTQKAKPSNIRRWRTNEWTDTILGLYIASSSLCFHDFVDRNDDNDRCIECATLFTRYDNELRAKQFICIVFQGRNFDSTVWHIQKHCNYTILARIWVSVIIPQNWINDNFPTTTKEKTNKPHTHTYRIKKS